MSTKYMKENENLVDRYLDPGEGNSFPLQWVILTWRIPSIEEPGRLPSL